MCCTSLSGCCSQFFWIDSKSHWKSKDFCPKLELLSLEFSRNCTGGSLQKMPGKNLPLSFEIGAQLRKGSSALQTCNCSYTPSKLHLREAKNPTNSFFPTLLEWKNTLWWLDRPSSKNIPPRIFMASLHSFVLVPTLPCLNSSSSLVLYPSKAFITFLIQSSEDGLYSESFYIFPIGFSLAVRVCKYLSQGPLPLVAHPQVTACQQLDQLTDYKEFLDIFL